MGTAIGRGLEWLVGYLLINKTPYIVKIKSAFVTLPFLNSTGITYPAPPTMILYRPYLKEATVIRLRSLICFSLGDFS